jgi:hypothetical protein
MAKKAKAKAKPGEKKAMPKKAAKKKKPASKKAAPPKIGVVSTIKLGQALKDAFAAGLRSAGVTNANVQYKTSVTYKRDKLKQEIENFSGTKDLIVTAGGLVAYEAANSYATIKFVSLVGGPPANPGGEFYGGVSLESYAANDSRIRNLVTNGHAGSPQDVTLYYNPNSTMSAAETYIWGGAPPVPASGDNDPSVYANDLANISVDAVVISADPFFQDTKNDLIAAANASHKYFCYPLQDYRNAGTIPKPTPGSATVFGPALKDPYTLLGQRAGLALAATAPLFPLMIAVPNGNPTDL